MGRQLQQSLKKSEWFLILVSVAILSIYFYYTIAYVFFTPYPGIVFTAVQDGWQINDSSQPNLRVGQILTQIGALTFQEYQTNRREVPFAGYTPGDTVPILTEDENQQFNLIMPVPTLGDRLKRFVFTGWFVIFWLPGTVILLFLRPRDHRWKLLVAFIYLIGIWILAGIVSAWRIGASRLILGAASWLMLPIFLHLHVSVPNYMITKSFNIWRIVLYGTAVVLAILELSQILPSNAAPFGVLIAVGGSLGLLIYRLVNKSSVSDKIATRLMLAGIILAFMPGIILQLIPQVLSISVTSTLGISLIYLSLPALPVFYIYAIFKHQLGPLEFRANRFLSLYSFLLLYPPVFLLLVLIGDQQIESSSGRTTYLLFISFAFVITTPPLLHSFQKWINHLAYGTKYNPNEVIRVLANQAPSVLSWQALMQILTNEILPSLLIRQSSLHLYEGNNTSTKLYTQNVPNGDEDLSRQQILRLAGMARFYRPLRANLTDEAFHWLRLVIPLTLRDQTIGVWLFGRRDPDDFYTQQDIDLLQTIANQIATAVENIRLYQRLKQQADDLTIEVSERTSELQAEKDRTQAILDSAGEGIFFMDQHGIILYTNTAMSILTGYSSAEMLGQTPKLWRENSSKINHDEPLWLAIGLGHKWQGELVQVRPNGSLYDVSLVIVPLQTAEDQIDGYVGVLSDISKLKEIDRLKSNIIANVSHELKTPLTNIRMYLTLLQKGNKEKWHNYLDVLNHESLRLTHLIEDILDLSRLESGTQVIHLRPIDLSETIRSVVNASSARALEKQIQLKEEIRPQLPLVFADTNQIEQVISNLITNALNYTPAGGQITILADERHKNDTNWVCITIADSGSGIAAEDLPHIFERFYRGHTESKSPGTGLGLSICKEIINRHHGFIEAESQEGVGSSFKVWLLQAN